VTDYLSLALSLALASPDGCPVPRCDAKAKT
jgi:hypothetical protein